MGPAVPPVPSASSGPTASSATSSDAEEAILLNVDQISDSEPEHSDEENYIPQLLDENIRPFLSSGYGTPQQSITEVINYFPISGHANAYGKKTTRYEYFYPHLPVWKPFSFGCHYHFF